MAIKLACPNPTCRRSMNAGDGLAGRRVKCPACGGGIVVPDPRNEEEEQDDDPPRKKSRVQRDDEDEDRDYAPRKKSRSSRDEDDDDDSDYGRKSNQGMLASKGLTALGAILFFVGVGALLLMIIGVFLPWVSINIFGMSTSVSGIKSFPGILILILSLLIASFALVALFALNAMLFKISLWSAFGWGLVAVLIGLLNIINGSSAAGSIEMGTPKISVGGMGNKMPNLDDMPNFGDLAPKKGNLAANLGDMGPKTGIGLWLVFAFGIIAAGDFGFLAVRSLFQGSGKRKKSERDW